MSNEAGLTLSVPVIETGPEAPKPEETGEGLLAGKFKTPEDLEKAYKELESKLGAKGANAPQEGQPQDEGKPEQQNVEVTPDNLADTLTAKGIDFTALDKEVAATGKLSEESYKALEKVGYTKDQVDGYLDKYVHPRTAVTQLHVNEIMASVGGRESFAQMSEWASQNLNTDELDAYNKAVSSGDKGMVRFAVSALHARYESSVGRDPQLLGGNAPRTGAEGFRSMEQVRKAMADPRYSKDPAYREEVYAKMRNSNLL